MKKSYTFTVLFLVSVIASGQIITFPDSNFKNALLTASPGNNIAKDINGNTIAIDANDDDEIDETEALAVYHFDLNTQLITSIEGIEFFTNVITLDIVSNIISTADLTALSNLQSLKCSNNMMESLDVTGLSNLEILWCFSNNLTALVAQTILRL